uniref:Cleft lip and palate associated transmembrane protein n=1 Tax=Kwoniella dejecticola CBS 10117 TaxID=1296121 RepID=A0A1A6A9L6_9TREE|nr:cleft lip and palate associated transmembrane protein [Kwoniella dejecticola CBS 10117]OBR86740.1 cleft lip and palate associated transmembrane protein [Kwoniella dejecticola CBS 10117]
MAGRAGQADAPAAPPRQPGSNDKIWGVVRSVAMFVAVQAAMKYGMQYMGLNNKGPTPPVPVPSGPADGAASAPPVAATPKSAVNAVPAWDLGTPLSMLLYTSTSPGGLDVNLDKPLVQWDGLTYGEWKDEREADLILDVPESVWAHNGSWYMDIVLVKGGGLPKQAGLGNVSAFRKQLTRFFPKRRIRKEKKLIGNKDEIEEEIEEPEPTGPPPIVAHWSNNLTLTIVSSGGEVAASQLSPVAAPFYTFQPNPNGEGKVYSPPIYPNDFWIMKESLYQINETTKTLPLHVTYNAISSMKFNIFSSMTASFDQAAAQQGAGTGMEFDEIKRTLIETSPWLLITTAIVTLLHTVFEFLAFSSDVSHWRKKDKDLVGVSLNTILTNCFVQLVILLYLQDSSEETSFMILFGQGIGLLIEAWKITKVTNIRIRPAPNSIFGYTVQFEDKRELSEDEKKTQEYDALAFRLVSYAAIPLLAGYTGYSRKTHRGWYSFIVSTLAQAIYMFGFVQLVPQLIINYKLKSVAHMPMKAMMYKTLSTVVDDFFAFCIRMPWLHRLACFRDDVVFLILLYQRWIYRIDYSRVNEYGQVNEGMVEDVGKPGEKKETKKTK